MSRTYYASGLQFTEGQLIRIEAALAALRMRKAHAEELADLRASDRKWEQEAIRLLQSALQSEMMDIAERRTERTRECSACRHDAEGHTWISLIGGPVRGACYQNKCGCERFRVSA